MKNIRVKSFGKTKDSSFSLNSLPLIPVISHSKLASLSYIENEKNIKTFELLNSMSSKTLSSKYNKRHTMQATNLKFKKFDKILENLEIVANETRFSDKRIELVEKVPVKGFIDQNTCQNFQVCVMQCSSPLRVRIKVKKGKIEIYTSFKILNPNRLSFDRKFENGYFDLHSPFPVFAENYLFIGVFAVIGASVKISCFFGPDIEHSQSKIIIRPQNLKSKLVPSQKYIQRFRDDPMKKLEFEEKLEKILEKRKNIKKIPTLQSKKNFNPTFSHKLSIDEKIQKVQKKKALIYDFKKELKSDALNKKENWKIADKETEKLKAILWFRKFFEENWTTLIVFCKISYMLLSAFKKRKVKKLSIIMAQMQAYKIQKNFRSIVMKGCPIKIYNLNNCKNHLKLYLKLSKNIALDQFGLRLIKLIKQVALNDEIKKKFLKFSKSIIIIQKAWKNWTFFNAKLFKSFLNFWNEVTKELIKYYNFKSKEKKKKKTQILLKLTNIPPDIKEKYIKDYLKICRKKLKNSQDSKQIYTEDTQIFTKLILESCLEKNIRIKRLPTIIIKKKLKHKS